MATLPTVSISTEQGTQDYTLNQLTALSIPWHGDKAKAVATLQNLQSIDTETNVIKLTLRVTIQSFYNGGISNVSIKRKTTQANIFENPTPVGQIIQDLGFGFYEFIVYFPGDWEGDWTFYVEGDNVYSERDITKA